MNAPSRRERGAAMLLAFLALLILVVVVGQLSVSANVDRSIALTLFQDVKYDYAARGAWHEACAMLIKDLKDEETEADEEGTGTEGEGTSQFEGAFGSGGGDLGEAKEGSATDSLADEWLDPEGSGGGGGGFGGGGGGDLDVRIRVVDEDRKMNLLCLAAQDDGFREEWKERFVRLLDTFREDSSFDLTNGEADDLVDRFEAWLRGDRDHDFPTYAQSTTEEADSKLAFGEARFVDKEEDEVFFPLGLDELVAVDDMSEFLLHGFIEDGRYVPGLMDVITVYSNVRIDPDALDELADAEEDDIGDSPFDEGGDDEQEELEEAEENAAEDTEDEDRATETNQGRVNINTAPMVVLRALMKQDKMPYTVLEKIDEFRREVLEDHLDHQKGFGDSSPDDFGVDADQAEDLEDQQEEKEEDFVFDNPDGVVERVEDWLHQTFSVGQSDQKEFGDLLSVKSHVFTIFVEIRKQESGLGQSILAGESYRPPDRVYRGVVWRRKHSDGKFQVITLVPLHPYAGAVPPDTEQYRKDHPFGF